VVGVARPSPSSPSPPPGPSRSLLVAVCAICPLGFCVLFRQYLPASGGAAGAQPAPGVTHVGDAAADPSESHFFFRTLATIVGPPLSDGRSVGPTLSDRFAYPLPSVCFETGDFCCYQHQHRNRGFFLLIRSKVFRRGFILDFPPCRFSLPSVRIAVPSLVTPCCKPLASQPNRYNACSPRSWSFSGADVARAALLGASPSSTLTVPSQSPQIHLPAVKAFPLKAGRLSFPLFPGTGGV